MNDYRNTSGNANMESNPETKLESTGEGQRFDEPVNIAVTVYRRRLCDPDNISIKWCLDSIVSAGILQDDSTKQIKEIRYKQVKISTQEEERTTLEIVKA